MWLLWFRFLSEILIHSKRNPMVYTLICTEVLIFYYICIRISNSYFLNSYYTLILEHKNTIV